MSKRDSCGHEACAECQRIPEHAGHTSYCKATLRADLAHARDLVRRLVEVWVALEERLGHEYVRSVLRSLPDRVLFPLNGARADMQERMDDARRWLEADRE